MKLNRLLLMSVMGLGLFACNNNDLVEGSGPEGTQTEGTTYVGLKINFNSSSSRATGDQPVDGDGTTTPPLYNDAEEGNEDVIHDVRIVVTDAEGNIQFNKVVTANATNNKLYTFQTTPGMKTFYAIVNGEALKITGLNATSGTWNPQIVVNKTASELAKYEASSEEEGFTYDTDKGFLMSSVEAVEQPIQSEVTEEQVLNDKLNNVAITVERVVAKVTMSVSNDVNLQGDFTLKELTCQIGNADNFQYNKNGEENKYTSTGTYLMAWNDNNVRKTNYYDYPTSNTADFWTGFTQTSLLGSDTYTLYPNGTVSNKARFYCLENTHGQGNYLFGNTTFVRVKATMTPKKTITFTAADDNITIEDGSETTHPETFYQVTAAPIESAKGAYVLASDLLNAYTTIVTGGSETEDNEKISAVITTLKSKGYQFTDAYEGGCGYYNVWVNDLKENNQFLNLAPVFRNDWYDLTIKSLTLPGSANPDDGNPGDQIHPDTYVGVTLTVRDWNKVNHNVDLQ